MFLLHIVYHMHSSVIFSYLDIACRTTKCIIGVCVSCQCTVSCVVCKPSKCCFTLRTLLCSSHCLAQLWSWLSLSLSVCSKLGRSLSHIHFNSVLVDLRLAIQLQSC